LRDLDSQIALDLTRYQEDSPAIQALRQKRKNLLPVLQKEAERTLSNKLTEVNNQIAGLETQAVKIIQAENSLNKQIKQLPELARRYTDLQRELIIATQSLNRFLEKRESLQVEAAQKEMPWQLIAPPELPQIPVSPHVQRNLILGAVAGLLAGLGAALFLEKLDNKFHSTEELKETTKLPLLGVIPLHKNLGNNPTEGETEPAEQNGRSRRSRNSYGYNYFPFLESFRSLYTNIGFLGSDTPVHSLVISSSIHAEGKSTVATYLAQAAAAMGRRVLLVDADLRLPQIHRILKLSNETGLSNAISTNVPVDDLIQRSPAWENLFILTAGAIPPDPTKLLSSHKMRNIMEHLRQQYDLVIYDTPPMLGLADASLIAPYTAGLAIVSRMDKTDRTMLTQTLDQLKLSRTQVLGAICNGVKDYKATTSYYHYYYQPRTQSAG
jgi:capsular exopolysaccharide synthesis family protein